MYELFELFLEKPELALPMMKEYIEKYKPVLYVLGKEILDVCNDFTNNKDYYKMIATGKKNMYDAYINIGFTPDEALALMINDNIRLLDNIKKVGASKKTN